MKKIFKSVKTFIKNISPGGGESDNDEILIKNA